MAKFTNLTEAYGEYIGRTCFDVAEVTVDTSVLRVEKTADRIIWTDTEPLTYTVRVTNNVPKPGGAEVVNMEFKDIIDPEIALLDTDSVTIDGVTQILNEDFMYIATTGLFFFIQLADIPGGETIEIKYSITKK